MSAQTRSFRAPLEKLHDSLGWTIARVPFDPSSAWKKMLRFRLKGTINGLAFRTSLFPNREGNGFFLLVNRVMQQESGARLGNIADFTLQPDLAPRPAELPDELAVLLDEEPGLRDFYGSFSESMRREIGKWILSPKSDEARMRRSQQMAERLLGAMEGEQQLPPQVEAAFRTRPKARAGWARMTPNQRRRELFAIYYYQSPDARTRRVDKLCDNAECH